MGFKDLKCDLTNCISNIGHVCIGKYENCPYYKLRKEKENENRIT